jgi:hypothetical protein
VAGSLSPPRISTAPPPVEGHFIGSGLVGGVQAYIRTYGNVAAHAAIARLSPGSRIWVKPNAENFGILGAKKYPYTFVGELVRAMGASIKKDEDTYAREFASNGIDFTLETVNRVILRHLVSPRALADRAQELWQMYHSAGRVVIEWVGKTEYLATIHDWPNHDVTVCKICMEARRRVVEHTRVNALAAARFLQSASDPDVVAAAFRRAIERVRGGARRRIGRGQSRGVDAGRRAAGRDVVIFRAFGGRFGFRRLCAATRDERNDDGERRGEEQAKSAGEHRSTVASRARNVKRAFR